MTYSEKIKYVKDQINELIEISPSGPLHLKFYTVTEYEDGPTLLSTHEQYLIVQKLEEERFIKNVELDADKRGIWFEKITLTPKSKKTRINQESYYLDLFYLKILYSKILEILDIFAKQYVGIRNTVLNHYYTVLLQLVNDILAKKEFAELRKDFPELYESLIGDIEDIDIGWEYLSKDAYNFLGKIEKKIILSGKNDFEPEKVMEDFLEKTDAAIESHQKYCKDAWDRTISKIDKNQFFNQTTSQQENISQVIKKETSLNIEDPPPFNDKERLSRFLRILPEKKVYDFLDSIYNAEYFDDHKKIFDEYEQYANTVFSRFENTTTNDLLNEFDNKFSLLNSFLSTHFFFVPHNRLTQSRDGFFKLYPEMKDSKEKEKRIFWRERLEELHNLMRSFKKKYREFLATAQKELSDSHAQTHRDPIPLEIRSMPPIKIEGLSTKPHKKKFPHKLPAGTKWENITIKFIDHEQVLIQIKQLRHTTDYKEMGFIGRGKNPRPSEQWTFLKVLAGLNGELSIKDAESREKYKKQKELLSNALKEYFSLDYDPFYPYRSSSEKNGNSYKIKIVLIPSENSLQRNEPSEDSDDELGLNEFLAEEAPQLYEE